MRQKFLRLYGGRQSFNIYDQIELEKVINTLRKTAESIGWDLSNDPVFKVEYQEIKARENILDKRNEYLEIQFKKLKEGQAKSNLAKYKEDLKFFKELIEDASRESELQDWLKEHMWVLGTEYLDSQTLSPSQFPFKDARLDFFLQKYDTFFDIVELKLPKARLFTGKVENEQESVSRSVPISDDLSGAISQIIHYLELITYMRADLEEFGVPVYKPSGIIIIGRTQSKKDMVRLKSISAYLTNINILSYDNLVQKAENFINKLESL